jgi:hypothetical protein
MSTMGKGYEYDAFISHAVEDKIPIADELYVRLGRAGLNVWYSGRELNTGDSIHNNIVEGLKVTRFGIVILSKNYLAKNWTMKELYLLMSKERPDHKVILPILYDVTPADLAAKDIVLADRFALKAEKGIDYLVEHLIDEINKGKQKDAQVAIKKSRRRWLLGVAAAVVLSGGAYTGTRLYDVTAHDQDVEETVDDVVARQESTLIALSRDGLGDIESLQVPRAAILNLYNEFREIKSYYRNMYTLITPDSVIRSRKNVEAALGISMAELTPSNNFGMDDPILFLLSDTMVNGVRRVRYRIENSMPLMHTQEEAAVDSDTRTVTVTYRNNVRVIQTTLDFPDDENIKRNTVVIYGFLPERMYVLSRKRERWRE